jgi:hypothetical protein
MQPRQAGIVIGIRGVWAVIKLGSSNKMGRPSPSNFRCSQNKARIAARRRSRSSCLFSKIRLPLNAFLHQRRPGFMELSLPPSLPPSLPLARSRFLSLHARVKTRFLSPLNAANRHQGHDVIKCLHSKLSLVLKFQNHPGVPDWRLSVGVWL